MKAFYMICFCIAIQGCATFDGRPESVIDVNDIVEVYTEKLAKFAKEPPRGCSDVKVGIDQALTAMDLKYTQFVNDISLDGKTKTTLTDFAMIGLGLAGTAAGGAPAKTVLHAISTGFAGANSSIDKNFFYEKSISALVSQMNADRKEKLSVIVQRYAQCENSGYSWFEAVHDLNDYYSAGTLLSAVTSISKNAGTREDTAEKEIKKTLSFTLSKDTLAKNILRQMQAKPKGAEAIMACWQKVTPALFLSGKQDNDKCSQGTLNAARLINAAECQDYQDKVSTCLTNINP